MRKKYAFMGNACHAVSVGMRIPWQIVIMMRLILSVVLVVDVAKISIAGTVIVAVIARRHVWKIIRSATIHWASWI